MSDNYEVETVSRQTVYGGHLKVEEYRLRHGLFAGGMGGEIQRELVVRGDVVLVLPYDPRRDEVVLIEQFRIGPHVRGEHAWTMEIVAGLIEAGEQPADVAHRELFEESGLRARRMEPLMGYYTSPGAMNEYVHLFIAEVDTEGAGGVHGLAHEGEDIRVHVVAFARMAEELAAGRYTIGPAIVALQWLAANREGLRARWLGK